MLQQWYEALWYGTPEQIKKVAAEIGPVFAREMDRVAVWPPAVRAGAFIRAVGYNPYDGKPDAVTGIVQEATYTDHPSYSWPYERRSGVNYAISQPPRAGVEEEGICDDVFVPEEDWVILLPPPVDRGRPEWLDRPTTTNAADLGATDASDPAARQAATSTGPPGTQDASTESVTGPATPTTLARLSFPTPATPAVAPSPGTAGPAGTPRPRGHGRHR